VLLLRDPIYIIEDLDHGVNAILHDRVCVTDERFQSNWSTAWTTCWKNWRA